MAILFRPRKKTLEESMAEVKSFDTMKELFQYLVKKYKFAGKQQFCILDLYVRYYWYDYDTGWETYVVETEKYGPLGFLTFQENEVIKTHILFSERKKLAKKYQQWCDEVDEKINCGRIGKNKVENIITFLMQEGFCKIEQNLQEDEALYGAEQVERQNT